MSELRDHLAQIPLRLPDNAITRYYKLGDDEIDIILNTILIALPERMSMDEKDWSSWEKGIENRGYNDALSDIKSLIEKAKQN